MSRIRKAITDSMKIADCVIPSPRNNNNNIPCRYVRRFSIKEPPMSSSPKIFDIIEKDDVEGCFDLMTEGYELDHDTILMSASRGCIGLIKLSKEHITEQLARKIRLKAIEKDRREIFLWLVKEFPIIFK